MTHFVRYKTRIPVNQQLVLGEHFVVILTAPVRSSVLLSKEGLDGRLKAAA
jgi:hypothetical protein